MKYFAFLLAASMAVSCAKPIPKMPGVYRMISQVAKSDTTEQHGSYSQLKIFTAQCVMYARYNEGDSLTAFGFGTYIVDQDGINETMLYSAADTMVEQSVVSHKLIVEPTEKGYRQTIHDVEFRGVKYLLTEEYESVGNNTTSPLDGAWTMTRAFNVTTQGDTVIVGNTAQYKVYYGGNFMYGHTWVDSLSVSHTGIGYGVFEMTGENSARETVQNSNYPGGIGSFNLELVFKGPDEFTQTITGENGNALAKETYKRLGK